MKETPQDKSLEERLGASKFSGEGFLGTDHRPVNEIIADDRRTLEAFFAKAPRMNPNAGLITGSICGYKVQEIEDPFFRTGLGMVIDGMDPDFVGDVLDAVRDHLPRRL